MGDGVGEGGNGAEPDVGTGGTRGARARGARASTLPWPMMKWDGLAPSKLVRQHETAKEAPRSRWARLSLRRIVVAAECVGAQARTDGEGTHARTYTHTHRMGGGCKVLGSRGDKQEAATRHCEWSHAMG